MPYTSHPHLETPPDETVVWRYMDFTKFADLLETSQLYFATLDELGDPLEGFLTNPAVAKILCMPGGTSGDLAFMRLTRSLPRVSCWHANAHESAAMWRLYLKSDEGIAVRTTVGRMKQALARAEQGVCIGSIKYLDFKTDDVDWHDNVLPLSFNKRRSFEHEREVRAVVLGDRMNSDPQSIAVDLPMLLDSVYLAPKTASWLEALVNRALRRAGLNDPAMRSALEAGPLY